MFVLKGDANTLMKTNTRGKGMHIAQGFFKFLVAKSNSIKGFVRPSVRPSVQPSVRWSYYLSIGLSIRRLVHPSVRLLVLRWSVRWLRVSKKPQIQRNTKEFK